MENKTNEIKLELDNICRTCLKENAKNECKNIFQKIIIKDEQLHVKDMLTVCDFIQVNENDGLPKLMCLECIINITKAYNFKFQCQESDLILRNYLKNVNNNEIKNFSVNIRNDNFGNTLHSEDLCDTFHIKSESNVPNSSLNIEQNSNSIPELKTIQYFKCKTCSEIFYSKQDLCHHIVKVHHSYLTCKICNITFPYPHLLVKHLVSHQDLKTELSHNAKNEEICDLSSNEKLIFQSINSPQKNSYNKCFQAFDSKKASREHAVVHEKPLIQACPICKLTFSHTCSLKRHIKTHEQKQVHLCSFCGKEFKRTDELRRHIRIHTNERPYACNLCDKSYKQSFLLKEHMRGHTNDKYICTVCGKNLSTYNGMVIHMKTHKGQKDHKCKVCGAEFIAVGQLRVHLRIHTNEKPFVCKFQVNEQPCEKAFRTKAGLDLHERCHTGERPYKCHYCVKAFPSSSRLAQHIRTHTGERKYCCDSCDKSFIKSQDLRKHKRIHTGELPFCCEICPERFISNDRLKGHVKYRHRIHQCKECFEYFSLASLLKKHMIIHKSRFICEVCGKFFTVNNNYVEHLELHKTSKPD